LNYFFGAVNDISTHEIRAAGPGVPCDAIQRLKLVTTVTNNDDALAIIRILFYEQHRYYTAHANGCGGEAVTYSTLYECARSAHRANNPKPDE
jgi:hypothetical protein